ncbi:hypothetical protein AX17_002591 [Amanita inopinata Kibby_2008]|nr:hypothetical protein AX17_002591 [Amanita inopinata Kibby_2008]
MPPVLRSFTVFQDSPPAEETAAPKQTKSTMPLKRVTRSSSSNLENLGLVHSATLTVPDKENLHPVTGERASLGGLDKKRKDGSHVLVTKLHNPPPKPAPGKKHKKELSIVLKDEGSPTKKRKASVLSASKSTGTAGQKLPKTKAVTLAKEGKMTGGTRKSAPGRRTTTRTRTISSLPKVAEEDSVFNTRKEEEKTEKPVPSQLSQADIDSRCYELTVKPLADVSQAYEDTSVFQDINTNEDKPKFQTVKESSVEPEIRDYYAPAIASSTNAQLGSSRKSPFEEPTGSAKTFSTPERKAIYSTFTFSSPSPSGARFSKTTRAGSVPRLEFA